MSRTQAAVADQADTGAPDLRALVTALLPPVLLSLVVWLADGVNHLLAHTLAELFSIVVAITALVVATTSRHFTRNHYFVFVSVAIGWCAGLDLLHMVTYKGLHLVASDSANMPTQFWIAARLLQAVAMAMAPIMLSRHIPSEWLHALFGGASLVMGGAIIMGYFPDAFIDGQGLMPFKVYSEYLVVALLGLSLLFMWHRRALTTQRMRWSISASVIAMMASELVLTQYVTLDDNLLLVGHLLKIVAYWFVYVALVRTTLSEPFSMLSRAASTYDAVPDPTYVVNHEAIILQANLAAARQQGRPAAMLVGLSAHALLHDAQQPLSQCPVCSQLAQAGNGFLKLLSLANDGAVECHVAPFDQSHQRAPVWVMVARDVSERERLSRERDTLVHELQERVKELLCFYELAQLCKNTSVAMPDLLTRVVELLPMAFTDTERLMVQIQSVWGTMGEPIPGQVPTLQASMSHAGEQLGTLTVAYRPDPWVAAPALCVAEKCLLDCVALLLTDTYARLHSQARVRRLTYLYDMLSATNRAITHCQTQGELIQMLRSVLVSQGAFEKLFIAVSDADHPSTRMYVDFQQGVDESHQAVLHALVGQVHHTVLSEQDGRISGKVITRDLSPPWAQTMPSLMAWESYLYDHGIRQWAAMPILCEGRLWGMVGLCAGGALHFDTEQVRLLEEMSVDLAFSLEHFAIERRRELAEMVSRSLGDRFTTVFQHSPVPMQIVSLYDGKLRVINQAHEHWLGYTLNDIPDAETWFEKAYPDLNQRAALMADWATSLARAQAGETVQSPELTLRDKAGNDHIAQGTVSVVNDDIIIAWTDLTATRHNEQALRDSEQRFRNMVESTVTAMYVRRDGKFLYVNPRYCEILGWTAQELVGRDVLDFTTPDEANLANIRQAWQQLSEPGQPSVSYTVPVRCKDGHMVELGLHARVITWDDGLPATIVMAQDITERKQAESKIANYVKQLEASMSGTLQAVANMVEMRDPYTAGHERRVGLIACALALEMGWQEPRARSLEQLGLVHDIGKIAVPSEILTKPTRLSPIEYELIKGHVDAGYEILKHIPFPTPVADIIRQHHERMDGSGYPLGLKGDAILPEARILAVADVIESMASHRPYRPALGLDVALAEVEKGRGRLYDPEVCDAALRLIRDQGYVLPT